MSQLSVIGHASVLQCVCGQCIPVQWILVGNSRGAGFDKIEYQMSNIKHVNSTTYGSSLPGLHNLNPPLSPHEHQMKLILKLFYHVPFSKKTDIVNKLLLSPNHVMEYVTRL